MPRKKTEAQLLKMPKHKYTQCDFYLKPKLSKGTQSDKSLDKLEAVKITENVKTINCASQTEWQSLCVIDEELLPPPIYVKHASSQCNFFIKPMCSRSTQVATELLFENNPELNRITLKRKHDEAFFENSNLAPKSFIAEINQLPVMNSTNIINSEMPGESDEIVALKSIEDYIKTLPGMNICIKRNNDRSLSQLEVTRDDTMIASSNYSYSPIKLLFSISGFVKKVILFKETTQDVAFTSKDTRVDFEIVKKALSSLSTDYVFCPGIPEEVCRNYKTKNLENIRYPFKRHQSVECSVWYIPPSNAPKRSIQSQVYQCRKCRILNSYILKERRKKSSITSRAKLKRVSPLSNCKIRILTRISRSKRFYNNRCLRSKLNKKIKQLEVIDKNINSSEAPKTIKESNESTPKVHFSWGAKQNLRDMWTQVEITYANCGTQTISVIDLQKSTVNSKVNSSCQSDLTFSTISSLTRM